MAGYMVYWPGEQIRKLKKAKDTGPIRVVLGSVHSRMPSIASVKVGDVVKVKVLEVDAKRKRISLTMKGLN